MKFPKKIISLRIELFERTFKFMLCYDFEKRKLRVRKDNAREKLIDVLMQNVLKHVADVKAHFNKK
jgi:hypothetical protein